MKERQATYGPNELPQPEPPSPVRIFLRQFRGPLIYVLAVAAVVSLAIGDIMDAGFIAIVLLSDAAIGGFQEWHAERSIQALQQLIRTQAAVVRGGEVFEIDSIEAVPGDVVILVSGNRVPADVRLLSQTSLELDESTLTGESTPVSKAADWLGDETTPVADRRNMAFAGSTVTRGRGRGVVVATGSWTVVGELARTVVAVERGELPLIGRMEQFTRTIGITALVLAAAAIVIGVGIRDIGFIEMFLFAVALMVAAIPEGLPVSMTVALGVATRRMAKVDVIVRQMVAVEGFGSCTLIAADKTGSLTENELTVRRVRVPSGTEFEVTGQEYEPDGDVFIGGEGSGSPTPDERAELERIARAAVLCNEATLCHRDSGWTGRGDPTDVALLAFARKVDWERESTLERYTQIDEIRSNRSAASPRPIIAHPTGGSECSTKAPRSRSSRCASGRGPRRRRPDELRSDESWPRWPGRGIGCWRSRRVRSKGLRLD